MSGTADHSNGSSVKSKERRIIPMNETSESRFGYSPETVLAARSSGEERTGICFSISHIRGRKEARKFKEVECLKET